MGMLSKLRTALRPEPYVPSPETQALLAPVLATSPGAPVLPTSAEFIAQFEGFRERPYLPTPRDVPTIGHGTTRYPDGRPVSLGDPPCTRQQALEWLACDVERAEDAVDVLVDVPLTKAMRVALSSLVYNIGRSAFAGSTLREVLNRRRYGDAAREFLRWDKQAGQVLPGLVKRRRAEAELFLSQGVP